MQQPGHTAIAIEIGMQVREIKVDHSRFQQIIHLRFGVDECDELLHMSRQHFQRQSGVFDIRTHNVDGTVAIIMSREELAAACLISADS